MPITIKILVTILTFRGNKKLYEQLLASEREKVEILKKSK
jgi:hypothetical protein